MVLKLSKTTYHCRASWSLKMFERSMFRKERNLIAYYEFFELTQNIHTMKYYSQLHMEILTTTRNIVSIISYIIRHCNYWTIKVVNRMSIFCKVTFYTLATSMNQLCNYVNLVAIRVWFAGGIGGKKTTSPLEYSRPPHFFLTNPTLAAILW